MDLISFTHYIISFIIIVSLSPYSLGTIWTRQLRNFTHWGCQKDTNKKSANYGHLNEDTN
jgi:hypothetical protein